MKINDLKQRLRKERPMMTITVRIPEDVIDDLKRLAPVLGFSGYQPLMRAYIGQGLRADLERLEGNSEVAALIRQLRSHGVEEEVINQSIKEMAQAKPKTVGQSSYVYEYPRTQAVTGWVMAESSPEYIAASSPEE